MVFDAMAHDASVPANPKDIAKKKRINRTAKLKQCKLDARREQWLSQVKNKGGCKAAGMAASVPPSHPPMPLPRSGQPRSGRAEEHGGLQDGNLESPARSPTSSISSGNKNCSCGGSNISSWSSSGSWSRSTSDAEEEPARADDNVAFDDWEAVADALYVDHDDNPNPDPVISTAVESTPLKSFVEFAEPGGGGAGKDQVRVVPRAWRPDDVFRPQSLPNLAKQRSFPADMERHRGSVWAAHHGGILAAPSSCPICYEDLDPTDSSFLPCACGFHLCLFCHKRILEDDGRCPGCRKKYTVPVPGAEMGVPIRLSRSCSIKY